MAKMVNYTNLPGQGRIWKVGNDYYYVIKGPRGSGRMAWRFRTKSALKAAFPAGKGIKVHRRMSKNRFNGLGVVRWGTTDEIQNTTNHPFSQFLQNWKKEAQINPMLRDPEVIAVYAQATLEGRVPTRAEVETTDWWRSRTAEQRAWVQLASGDPKTAKMIKTRNRIEARDALISAGFQGNPWGASAQLADQFTRGEISKQQLERGIAKLTDPFEDGANKFAGRSLPETAKIVKHKKTGKMYARYDGKDYLLGTDDARAMFRVNNPEIVKKVKVAGGVAEIASKPFGELSALEGVDEVRDMVEEWLGPKFAAGWSNRVIEKWAHKVRGNEEEMTKLEEELRRQRSAVLPGYDENLTYEQIATPWRAVVQDVWGQQADESSDLFYQILKANDLETSNQLLRKEGLRTGNKKVQMDATRALTQSFGGQVTGVMGSG